jgi:hemerythrin superfamily protein
MTAAKRKPSKTAKSKPAAETVSIKRFDGKTVKQPPAVAFLMQQHRDVAALFDAYEKTDSSDKKLKLSEKICLALAVHAKIEEELLYPEAREKIEESDLVDEAAVEHATAKDLIAQIEIMQVSDRLYDAKVKVLGEYIAHHVEEEETELFPQVKRTDMDLAGIGKRLKARAAQVTKELTSSGETTTKTRIAADARLGAHI